MPGNIKPARLLITRPEIQALETAQKLEKLGFNCLTEPLLSVQETGAKIPSGTFDTIIITSKNALPALDKSWPVAGRDQISLVTTGEITKNAARALGFTRSHCANGSAEDIVRQFDELAPDARNILYPCARYVSVNLDKTLSSNRINCRSWVVYETVTTNEFSKNTRRALKNREIDGILLYSKKTARIFENLWEKNFDNTSIPDIFTLSKQISTVLPSKLSRRCKFPLNPNENDLFDLITKSIN